MTGPTERENHRGKLASVAPATTTAESNRSLHGRHHGGHITPRIVYDDRDDASSWLLHCGREKFVFIRNKGGSAAEPGAAAGARGAEALPAGSNGGGAAGTEEVEGEDHRSLTRGGAAVRNRHGGWPWDAVRIG
jgi:hypothetical protein